MAARKALFRTAFRKLGPSWLVDGEGEKVWYSLMLVADAFAERLRLGVLARHPEHAPEDALPHIGRDRGIVRGFEEVVSTYAQRLVRAIDDWKTAGNAFALMRQLQAYLGAAVRIRTVDVNGNWYTLEPDGTTTTYLWDQQNWDWDGAPQTPRWARFWVIIYPLSTGIIEPSTDIDAEETIGTTAPLAMVRAVRGIVQQWKPAGTCCEWIIIAFDETSFDPTAAQPPNPDGTWQYHGVIGSGNRQNSRLGTARYWRGPACSQPAPPACPFGFQWDWDQGGCVPIPE